MTYSGRHPWDANDPYPEDDCDHEDYEADILTGMASCGRCGHRWMQTAQEIERERQAQIAYDAMCEAWEREQRSLSYLLRRWVNRVRDAIWPRRRAEAHDEIPF